MFAGLLLTSGALGDRFGRKGALTAGLVIFGAASTAAAFAGGVNQLVGARAVMGVGAALIMPATLSIITNVFTDPRERAIAIGLWSGVAGMAIALGPVAGGFLLEHFWWGSVFFVNVPIVIGRADRGPLPRPHLAQPGSAADRLGRRGAVDRRTGLARVGNHRSADRRLDEPADPRLPSRSRWSRSPHSSRGSAASSTRCWTSRFFRNPRFTAASLTVTLVFFALIGFVFLATQYLQFVLGYTPLQAGIRTLPFAVAMMIIAPASSKLVEWAGTKRVVVTGMVVFTSGLLVASTSTVSSGYPRIAIAMLLLGSGMGLALAPSTESIMGSLPLDKAGVGSAVNDTSREVGAALGVAVVGSLLSSIYGSRFLDNIPASVPGPARDAADSSLGAALGVSAQLGRAGAGIADAAREAFVYAMSRALVGDGRDRSARRGRGVALPARARDTDDGARGGRCRGGRDGRRGRVCVSPLRRARSGSSARCRPGRSSHPGSSPGTAGGSPRRNRTWAQAGSRW